MRKRAFLTTLLIGGWLAAQAQTNDLPRTSPEAVGMRSEQVSAFFDSLLAYPKTEIHSCIVMRHGKVVGEMYPAPFRAEFLHTQFSCSKTFVAAAVGIAIGEKKLRLTDKLVSFFPDQLPNIVSWQLKSITVEDLLTMRSGFVVDTKMRTVSRHWVRDYLAHPMNAQPGTKFQYDSIDTYLLSAIVQKVTGMTVMDYMKQHVFQPLNIREVQWELSPENITTGGWGLYIQSESLAKFGQLLLQRGKWHNQQLIPALWVDAMMKRQTDTGKGKSGYGYQMWTCNYPTAMQANGAYGQFIIVVPRQDVVVVITQCTTNDTGREQAHIWNTLFKGMQREALNPSNSWTQLKERTWTLPLLEGEQTNLVLFNPKPRPRDPEPYQDKTFLLEKNPLGWSQLHFVADSLIEITDTAQRTGLVEMGYQQWKTSRVSFYPLDARYATVGRFRPIRPPFRIGACYAWRDDELQAKLHYVDWMSSVLLRIKFQDDRLEIVAKENYLDKPVSISGTMM
jgi:CubicO group peptidase (beta-lactamase class C family)